MFDYISEATKTESIELFSVDHPRLLHAAIGVNTEVAELLLAEDGDEINLKEEMGDVLWYVAIAADEFSVTFDDLMGLSDFDEVENDPIKGLLTSASDLLDQLKKVCFYGVELDEAAFGKELGEVLYTIQILANDEGWSLEDLMEANIAKLRRRYGEKFTTEAAVNRDIAGELEALA